MGVVHVMPMNKPSARINKEHTVPLLSVDGKKQQIALTEKQKQIIYCLLSERVTELKYNKMRDEDMYLELIKLLAIFEN